MRAPNIVLFLLSTLSACEGGHGGGDDTVCFCNFHDAGPDTDAGPACNPVSQKGCETGQKCGRLVESDDPFLHRIACVPDGTALVGETCVRGSAGSHTGYDDCVAGLECHEGVCARICEVGPPDSCRDADEGFGEGLHCNLELWPSTFGVCLPACDPNSDVVVDGAVVHTDCAADTGCYVNASQGSTACQDVQPSAEGATQNQDCIGPASGGCSLNGCASGFAPLLPNKTVDADGLLCARLCSPALTHQAAQELASGVNGKCSTSALDALGGTGGVASEHQCRFVQSLYEVPGVVSEQVGVCVPVIDASGGSFGDCTLLDWDGIKAAWASAPSRGQDHQQALDDFCLVNPRDPVNSPVKDSCRGLYHGCLSLEEVASGLAMPAP